ncbi:unnamed protein product [Ambrosiozyma monospora]|uniref:Unnamed protein product n=1 Tax=Ambrosiozyma monospora TaxID=43982 RepID=A0ACB5SZT9_AMBMO|nr:unnamed protein product [Ambrosiozyma monospora]
MTHCTYQLQVVVFSINDQISHFHYLMRANLVTIPRFTTRNYAVFLKRSKFLTDLCVTLHDRDENQLSEQLKMLTSWSGEIIPEYGHKRLTLNLYFERESSFGLLFDLPNILTKNQTRLSIYVHDADTDSVIPLESLYPYIAYLECKLADTMVTPNLFDSSRLRHLLVNWAADVPTHQSMISEGLVDLTLVGMPASSKVCLRHLSSLKKLHLDNCYLSSQFINCLPDDLKQLRLYCCQVEPPSIVLPSHLVSFIFVADPMPSKFVQIENPEKLSCLSNVAVNSSLFEPNDGSNLASIRAFLLSSPTAIETLQLIIMPFMKCTLDPDSTFYAWSDPCRFSQLKKLTLSCINVLVPQFNLCLIPQSVQILKLNIKMHKLSGHFSENIHHLDINLSAYDDCFETFWNGFASPLELQSLRTRVKECELIDMRSFNFKKLNKFHLTIVGFPNVDISTTTIMIGDVPNSVNLRLSYKEIIDRGSTNHHTIQVSSVLKSSASFEVDPESNFIWFDSESDASTTPEAS